MPLKKLGMYSGFIGNSIKVQYAYRFKSIVWVFHDLLTMLIQYYLWIAIFESNSGTIFDISLDTYVNYILIGLIVRRVTTCFIDNEIYDDIKSGRIGVYFSKPYSYPMMIFNKHIGYSIGGGLSLIPLLVVIILFFDLHIASIGKLFLFLLSLSFAFLNMFLLTLFFSIIGFWIINHWGLDLLRRNLHLLFSGELIALKLLLEIGNAGVNQTSLAFLADWHVDKILYVIGLVSYCMPFQTISYTPSGIYSGLISGQQEIIVHLSLQVFWMLVLFLLCQFLWRKAKKIINVFGG
ncbi:MAG TPA: hypothetical protein GXX33_02930 [Firmicutes bacterium]|nr:hypothetical protein [Bacillota bacterium]